MRLLTVIAASLLLSGAIHTAHAEPIGVEGARKLPIIDTHFHPMEWMKESEVAGRMAAHNVILWGGRNPTRPVRRIHGKSRATGR